ncbi:MAG: enoyl-CoA hydratase/isomerase family protein, partial [Burkholderiaceae bacterium]
MSAVTTPAAEPPYVLKTEAAGIVTLTLNRGERFNALSEQMLAALQAELDAMAADPQARVVVLAAAGRAFCAGHDLKQMIAGGDDGQGPSAAYY